MKRNEFLSAVGVSAATLVFAPFLTSCSKGSGAAADPGTGGNANSVDFTLDLTAAANAPLVTNGGSLVNNGVIIAKTSGGSYIAVASACTHQGYTIIFDSANNRFHCNNHGSNYSTSGSVLLGPATTALKVYNVSLSGNNLRIFG